VSRARVFPVPGDLVLSTGLRADCFSAEFLIAAGFSAVAWEVSSWSARSRSRLAAQPRTNELDADERRRIMGGEECRGLLAVWGLWVVGKDRWLSPARGCGRGLACTHPAAATWRP